MAGSVNKVILIGHTGRDPEIRTMQSGRRIANLSLATSESWKDKATGERKEKTEWHRVVVFNQGLVDIIEKYVRKGSKLYIEGMLATRKWTDNSGVEKYTTEIVLKPYRGNIGLLDSKGSGGPPPATPEDYGYDFGYGSDPEPQHSQAPVDEYEDEIPF